MPREHRHLYLVKWLREAEDFSILGLCCVAATTGIGTGCMSNGSAHLYVDLKESNAPGQVPCCLGEL